MIKITIELIPGGVGEPKEIWHGRIWNNLTGSLDLGNYSYEIGMGDGTVKTGKVAGFERKKQPVWLLLYDVLFNIFGDTHVDNAD